MEIWTRRDIFIVEWTSISETAAQDMHYCRAIIPHQSAKVSLLFKRDSRTWFNARRLTAAVVTSKCAVARRS
jgi:hypothetical protein